MKPGARTPLEPGRGYEIRGGSYEGRILTIGSGDIVDSIIGGATFRDCELRILSATRQSLNFDATFIDCDVRTSKPLTHKQMARTSFIRCRFSGHLSGCEFGPKFRDSPGRVERCDFSGARLLVSEFFDCDFESLSWPDWPHIHLLYGEDLSWTEQLPDDSLPQELLGLIRLPRHESVTPRSVLSAYLPAKGLDIEKVWAMIQDLPQVWFPSKSEKTRATPLQVEQALGENRKALARTKRTRERTVLLGNLHRSWLKSVRRVSDDAVDLLFDCSFLRERVPHAPERVRVRLHQGLAHHRLEGQVLELDGDLDRFMLMGVAEEEEHVVLKPHRKERGQVVLSFESLKLFDDQGDPIPQDTFLKAVAQYYGQNAF
jgi:hypothetical protein